MRQSIYQFINRLKQYIYQKFDKYNVNLPYIIIVLVALVVVVLGINGFIELTDTVQNNNIKTFDASVTEEVTSYRQPILTDYFTTVTYIGDVYGYAVVLALTIIISRLVFKRWKYVVQISFVLVLSAISNLILKRFFDRARPEAEHLVVVKTLSYPSGHAMSAMAFYGFVIYLFYKYIKNPFLKILAILLTGILILSIGVSRIYLGVHFPSDIIGGFIAGFIWVVFCILIFNLIEVFRKDPETPDI